jgi:hypothetical protein
VHTASPDHPARVMRSHDSGRETDNAFWVGRSSVEELVVFQLLTPLPQRGLDVHQHHSLVLGRAFERRGERGQLVVRGGAGKPLNLGILMATLRRPIPRGRC